MGKALYALYGLHLPLSGWGNRIWQEECWKAQVLFWESGDWGKRNSSEKPVMPLGLKSIFKYIIVNSITPVYNFINDRLVDESTDLKPFSQHLFLCVFRCFWRKWPKISGCEYPDLIQNEIPVHSLFDDITGMMANICINLLLIRTIVYGFIIGDLIHL